MEKTCPDVSSNGTITFTRVMIKQEISPCRSFSEAPPHCADGTRMTFQRALAQAEGCAGEIPASRMLSASVLYTLAVGSVHRIVSDRTKVLQGT